MARYQIALVEPPKGWRPARPDGVPSEPGDPCAVLAEADDLFVAVRQAVEHNGQSAEARSGRWAVVVQPGSRGRTWPGTRLCTPLSYRVIAVWWPEGWEPATPLDVPNCAWQVREATAEAGLTYGQAVATVQALNRQCMDAASSTWYVVAAVENEPVSRTVSYDSTGSETTVEVRQLHVMRPEAGGRGDCSYCPAHAMPCAQDQPESRTWWNWQTRKT